MKVHQFVREAEAMRLGRRYPHVGIPQSYGRAKAKRHIHAQLDAVYSALWGFRIKHPDSTRSARARRRDLERHQARQLLSIDAEMPMLPRFHY